MNRATFMMQLRRGLAGLPQNEIEDICADYEVHFSEGTTHGRSEDAVAAALGDPSRLARELRAEVGFKRWEQNRNAANFLGVVLALLGLATIDIVLLFPLLCALAAIFFGLSVACLAVAVAGVVVLLNLLPLWPHFLPNVALQVLTGIGLFAGGVGGGALLILFIDWLGRLLVRYARLHYHLLNSANDSV
jgi:uncharacterized membrane protein